MEQELASGSRKIVFSFSNLIVNKEGISTWSKAGVWNWQKGEYGGKNHTIK